MLRPPDRGPGRGEGRERRLRTAGDAGGRARSAQANVCLYARRHRRQLGHRELCALQVRVARACVVHGLPRRRHQNGQLTPCYCALVSHGAFTPASARARGGRASTPRHTPASASGARCYTHSAALETAPAPRRMLRRCSFLAFAARARTCARQRPDCEAPLGERSGVRLRVSRGSGSGCRVGARIPSQQLQGVRARALGLKCPVGARDGKILLTGALLAARRRRPAFPLRDGATGELASRAARQLAAYGG